MLKSKKWAHFLLAFSAITFAACADVTEKGSKEWPSSGYDYTNQRMSPLTQINTGNIQKLGLAWQFKTGVAASFQATPIVTGGVMYVSLPYNHVVALDARTGKELWRYQHERKVNWKMCCGPANRGVAVSDGQVFVGTVDARLIALDAKTGAKNWDINVADDTAQTENISSLSKADAKSHKDSYGATGIGIAMAPIVYRGKVIVGVTGVGYGLHVDTPRIDAPLGAVIGVSGLYGRPGFLAAYDVNNGKRVWQFDTIDPMAGRVFLPKRHLTVFCSIETLSQKRKMQRTIRMHGAMAAARPGVRRRLIARPIHCFSAPAIHRRR